MDSLPYPDVVRSAYAELCVTDLESSKRFWVDRLGFFVSAEEPGVLYLRGYEEFFHHSLILRQNAIAACARMAFRVRTPADLDKAENWYQSRNCETRRYDGATTRGVGPSVRVSDPLGFTVEFFHEFEPVERLVQRYDIRRGASISRIDHINLATPDIPRAYELYRDLGFGLSETIQDGDTLLATWMYRKQSVHDVAFTQGSGPQLHHLGFAVPESHHVLSLCDVLGAANEQDCIERGPGRHGVSNAFYVYLRDPDGHRLEIYTSDYYTGDPGHPTLRWDVKDDRRRDFWGNPVVPRWYAEASRFLDLDGNLASLHERASDEQRITVGADGFGVDRS